MFDWNDDQQQQEYKGLVKRPLGYRCQFKCLTMEGAVEHPRKPGGTIYGSIYESHFYCSYCERYFPLEKYGGYKRCPCCNRIVRRKSATWKKLLDKPVIKYIE